MDIEGILSKIPFILSKISQSERQIPYCFTCMWNQNNKINEQMVWLIGEMSESSEGKKKYKWVVTK